uniref:Uncharacterized protein n=1 Tax=Romanomermis culicivorax TaxID=13658 RepID=A0A915KTT5_ROMCU
MAVVEAIASGQPLLAQDHEENNTHQHLLAEPRPKISWSAGSDEDDKDESKEEEEKDKDEEGDS